MIVNQSKLEEAILQAMREVNDACYQLRLEGVVVLLPEFIDFEVDMVTGNDINVISRASTESEANGGETITLREQLAGDVETSTRIGSQVSSSAKSATTNGTETSTMDHPSVQTTQSGGDLAFANTHYYFSADE